MLYVLIRHKWGECLGVFTSFAKAQDALNQHLEEKESTIEHVSSSDAEGWMEVESSKGEFYTIHIINQLDTYYG